MKGNMNYTVHAGWEEDRSIGTLSIEKNRGKEMISFSFSNDWLSDHGNLMLDPFLQPWPGRQFAENGLWGCFSDAAPDRWGRMLMKRREMELADREKRVSSNLTDSDYLLGVEDTLRTGGLRLSANGVFLAESPMAVPPLARLRALEDTSRSFERGGDILKLTDLEYLVSTGSSLGGARPKVNVVDEKGNLWIAKFTSLHDDFHTECWEMVLHDLAVSCGIEVPDARLEKLGKNEAFLIRRFDREGKKRIHFASAMTMTGKKDGEAASFLDIAEWISSHGCQPEKDLQELWKRMVFSIIVNNTDCHLRNHGFLLGNKGWHLSPAYDMNPSPFQKEMALSITENDFYPSLTNAIEMAPYYGIREGKEEVRILVDMVLKQYAGLADQYRVPNHEIRIFGKLFERNSRF